MKVFQIQDDFGIDNLRAVEREARHPGPGEVRIRVRASSLNFRDLMTVQGSYNPRQKLPLIPLSDGAGEVLEVGEGVTRVAAGDRVAGIFAQNWLAGGAEQASRGSTLGGPNDGMLAEEVVLHEDGVVKLPAHLSFEEAATLPCAGVTAWNALVTGGGIKAGDTVLLLGTGGVSIFGLQFSGLCGARAIVTSSSDEKLERARELGAWQTINYRQNERWHKQVQELTGGRGADHVVEVGGAGTLMKSLGSVRVGGTVTMIGVLSGVSTELDVRALLMRSVRLQGLFVGSRAMFEDMNAAIDHHGMRPVIDRVFDFDQAPEAFRYMGEGQHFGKIVIRH
ncbi:MAG TPA: NAD(P)-dependent alcohol dehydrogenase [Gammaproteobacteria bacterium]|nr:NAD(P)-dependent alcohol dehydrogenase [Gammaproteobacteria bacterium]